MDNDHFQLFPASFDTPSPPNWHFQPLACIFGFSDSFLNLTSSWAANTRFGTIVACFYQVTPIFTIFRYWLKFFESHGACLFALFTTPWPFHVSLMSYLLHWIFLLHSCFICHTVTFLPHSLFNCHTVTILPHSHFYLPHRDLFASLLFLFATL